MRLRLIVAILTLPLLVPALTPGQEPFVAAMLDRYAAGDYEAAVQMGPLHVAQASALAAFRKGFTRDADAWIARDPDHREARRFIAASYVLELTHAIDRGALTWSEGESLTRMRSREPFFEELQRLFEWACELLRKTAPRGSERAWWLASVHAFAWALRPPNGSWADGHALHALDRFPDEPRLQLAATLFGASTVVGLIRRRVEYGPEEASEIVRANEALQARRRLGGRWATEGFSQVDESIQRRADVIATLVRTRDALWPLQDVPAAQPEASLFLAATAIAFAQHDAARRFLAKAEGTTTDPYYVYLTAFLRGRIDEMDGRSSDAIAAYRRAASTVPGAHAATTALVALLWQAGQPVAARALVARMQTLEPAPEDPWEHWWPGWRSQHGERLWAARLAELHQELDQERR